ncbi:MAG: TrkA family potassium uptake protein [Bacteroidaceae bacterium]|jgi:trk system potassium uptake protein TrkA|nr:TrkA family potassium uptake protein [Bacteroidaceae bacterium]
MKCLVVGLGDFGRLVAGRLTDGGHEVIGVDVDERRVDEVKERISVAYILDATERKALRVLPFDELDCVIVAIGGSMDASLRAVLALKELVRKGFYVRALDEAHGAVLAAMGVAGCFYPVAFSARLFADGVVRGDLSDFLLR